MTATVINPVNLVTSTSEISALAQRLMQVKYLAVDTESNSLYAYRERVCLIQFSEAEGDFLVDPLAARDLSCLAPVFADRGIEKVFHAAEYDLIGLRRDFGFEVSNLFDTMVAARILGRQAIGLSSLLEVEFGISLEKKFQRANWGQRPLPETLLDYARLDTHYLVALRDRLKAELVERELMALAEEDFQRLAAYSPNEAGQIPGNHRPADCWRINGSRDLSPQAARVLQKLCEYRDETARQWDRPLFKVMSDQSLLAIAQARPGSLGELGRLPGMSSGQIQQHGRRLVRAVREGMEAAPLYPPRQARPDPAFSERLDALQSWRKQTAVQMGVLSDVVLPRDLMHQLAFAAPRSQEELGEVLRDVPWRLEHYGEQILDLMGKNDWNAKGNIKD